jgi:hypothetical protein
MIVTVLSILWVCIVIVGILSLIKGFETKKEKMSDDENERWEKDHSTFKAYGSIITIVGIAGLYVTLYNHFVGNVQTLKNVTSKSNFGFKFY